MSGATVSLVSKQYYEEVYDEQVGAVYHFWDLVLAVDGAEVGVRIYADEPAKAHVAISPRPVDDEQHATLRAVAEYLEQYESGAKLHVIGDSGGYEELEEAIVRKRARSTS